jgi:hypothetical protein
MFSVRLMLTAVILELAIGPLSFVAKAADDGLGASLIRNAEPSTGCRDVRQCGPAGCNWHRVCRSFCPDGVSCYPLYGAYGPYGGVAYWGSYTDSGWGYHRRP